MHGVPRLAFSNCNQARCYPLASWEAGHFTFWHRDRILTLFELAGYLGAACYLGSYAALQIGLIRGNGYVYACLNMCAAILVVISLTRQFNLPSMIVQISWISVSVIGIVRVFWLTHAIRFSDQEKDFLESKLPMLSKISGRRFLNLGHWLDAAAGATLIREGETHGALVYLATGSARVYAGGQLVGSIDGGNFVGEMTVLHGTPATATVVLAEDARYFRIKADKLRRLGGRDVEFQIQLENALNRDTSTKLVAANKRMSATAEQEQSP